MKIGMLSVYFLPRTVGGVEFHIYHLTRALMRLGHEVTVIQPVVTPAQAAVTVERERIGDVSVARIIVGSRVARLQDALRSGASNATLRYLGGFVRKLSYNAVSGAIAKTIREQFHEIDLLHQHDFSSSWRVTRSLSRQIPCVLTNHTGEFLFMRRNRSLKWALKPLLSHYKAIVGPSRELCDMGFDDPRVSYIPNGVDDETFSPVTLQEKFAIRGDLGLHPDELVVICARRWAPTKGIKTLIEAIPRIKHQINQRVRFLMVGSDYDEYSTYRNEVLQLIRDLRVEPDLMLVGNTSSPTQMANYLRASDVAVLPSLMEATSLSGLEAMSVGLPVVATNVGGLPEIISDRHNGLLVPPEHPDSLAEALVRVLKDTDLRSKMGERGRAIAVESYSWDAIARRTVAVYQRVLDPSLALAGN